MPESTAAPVPRADVSQCFVQGRRLIGKMRVMMVYKICCCFIIVVSMLVNAVILFIFSLLLLS